MNPALANMKRSGRLSCSAKITFRIPPYLRYALHSSILEVGKINVLTLSTDEGQDDTGPVILKSGEYPALLRYAMHSSILEIGKINVMTLSTDEGQDDTGPAILKRWGDYPALLRELGTLPSLRKINVLTLSTDEGQDDTDPAILERWGDYPTLLR
ncbi:hypothetical protein V6N13_104611 [Hibiscus sabdariffa]